MQRRCCVVGKVQLTGSLQLLNTFMQTSHERSRVLLYFPKPWLFELKDLTVSLLEL